MLPFHNRRYILQPSDKKVWQGVHRSNFISTTRYGRYTPILLAPAEGWGALWALLGAFGPSSVGEGSKQNILNLVSK